MEAFWNWWCCNGWGIVAFLWIMILMIKIKNTKDMILNKIEGIKEVNIYLLEKRVCRLEESKYNFISREELSSSYYSLKERIAILEAKLEERNIK